MYDYKKEIIEKINQAKLEFQRARVKYEQDLIKYQNALEAISEIETKRLIEDEENLQQENKTLRRKVIMTLKEINCPLTSRDIMDFINNKYPGKQYSFEQFSSQFSVLYRRENSGINKIVFENQSPDKTTFYFLDAWEENNFIKEEYFNKIIERYELKEIKKGDYGKS